MVWVVLFVGAWVACGVVAGMLSFAWFQYEYPCISSRYKARDSRDSFVLTVFGPISLMGVVFFLSGKEDGFKRGLKRFW